MSRHLITLENEIKSLTLKKSKPVIYLEAGHYDPRIGPDKFALSSLSEAITFLEKQIKTHKSDVKFVLGVLVDDLGLECGSDSCSIKDLTISKVDSGSSEELPKALESLLKNSKFIRRERVLRFSERTTKNRAIQSLRKSLKNEDKNLLIQEKGTVKQIYFQSESVHNVLLAEFEGDIFRAKCPSIMGQHYQDCFIKIQQRFPEMTHLIVADWSERIDYSKVTTGSEASFRIFLNAEYREKIKIMNIFFHDSKGTDSSYEISEQPIEHSTLL